PELAGRRWRKVVREMTSNDPVISAVLFAIEMLVRQVTWDIKAASEKQEDQEAADFLRGALFEDMSQSWADTVAEILSFLPWGWNFTEIVYKRRSGDVADPTRKSRFTDGRIGWRKWATRAQETLEHWDFDDEGGVQAMIQSPPPDYALRTIPIEKALLFRTSTRKGNPEPPGILRSCYRPWYFKSRIENIEGIGIERDLAGLPIAFAPPELFKSNASAADKELLATLQKIVTSIKRDEQEGLVFPLVYDKVSRKPLYDLKLLSSGGRRQFDTDKVIQRYDQRILMTCLADFLLLGSKSVGSFALSSDKTDLFGVALGAWVDSIAAIVNRHAVPRLFRLNGRPTDKLPELTHGDIESPNLVELGDYIQKISGTGVTLTPEQQQWLLQQVKGMPFAEDAPELEQKKKKTPAKDSEDETDTDPTDTEEEK
ncbi:MAG: hypothetical protein LC731_03215, partial [Acidobacteria bacterium]|nr:hypothetical protein [Acidobacteriota bacterium]